MNNEQQKESALLVSVYQGKEMQAECLEHLDELALLVDTFGMEVAHKEPCMLRKFDPSTCVTKGKLEELVALAKNFGVTMVVFDDEITPGQQRNLEKAFGVGVLDRTEIILGVFGQRAHTKEAHLQVELAQVRYEMPRLKRLWTHLSRQKATSGSGAYLKGMGEKQIEVDRRLLNKRIDRLKNELEVVRAHRKTQRTQRQRSEIPTFALIGYTNAGKSTLLNALTEAGVFVEDKLFATLDTTTRKFTLSNGQEVLLIDTVGFIRKLPHLLVAAFKSTLDEAIQADILIHLVDASNSVALDQAETTLEVLKELGAQGRPTITVANKVDLCENGDMVQKLRFSYPQCVQVSALQKTGFEELERRMIEELSKQRKIMTVRIPQSEYALVSEVMRSGHVLQQEYEGNDVILEADVPTMLVGKLKGYEVSYEWK